MGAHHVRLPLRLLAAIIPAFTATAVLRPRRGLIDPAPVDATAYFSASELDRARSFQHPRRLLALAQLAVSGGALALVVLRTPRPLRSALERVGAGRRGGSAATGAGLSLTLEILSLPLAVAGERQARSVGLSTRSWRGWAADSAKAGLLGALFAGGAASGLSGLMRRYRASWWVPAAAVGSLASAALTALSPVLLEPLFNDFDALEEGPLRGAVLELARAAGVDVGEVYRVDASRRTSAANAYVGGLFRTKRVVLYDTLLDAFTPAEVRSVVAHELAHVRHRDVVRSLTWLTIAAPGAAYLMQGITERLLERPRAPAGKAMAVPAAALALTLAAMPIGVAGNLLSRVVEARADAFALNLTADPEALIGVERALAVRNLSDPSPPPLLQALFATHPPATTRIGYALTWQRDQAASARS